jgi:hypothetical protein
VAEIVRRDLRQEKSEVDFEGKKTRKIFLHEQKRPVWHM